MQKINENTRQQEETEEFQTEKGQHGEETEKHRREYKLQQEERREASKRSQRCFTEKRYCSESRKTFSIEMINDNNRKQRLEEESNQVSEI